MIKIRLSILADALERLVKRPRKKLTFSLNKWFNRDRECGTVCCAVGLGTTLPELRKRGLIRSRYGGPAFRDYMGWAAAQSFFGISYHQALYLFSVGAYAPTAEATGPEQVAARIRRFIAGSTI